MKALLVAALAALALSVTATAGNGSICRNGAQTGDGTAFSSIKECQKADEVFRPSLTIEPSHVSAGERFTLTASGFHVNAAVIVYFALAGQAAYGSYAPGTRTAADGSFSIPFVFEQCGADSVTLDIILVDEYGVYASAPLILC